MNDKRKYSGIAMIVLRLMMALRRIVRFIAKFLLGLSIFFLLLAGKNYSEEKELFMLFIIINGAILIFYDKIIFKLADYTETEVFLNY